MIRFPVGLGESGNFPWEMGLMRKIRWERQGNAVFVDAEHIAEYVSIIGDVLLLRQLEKNSKKITTIV